MRGLALIVVVGVLGILAVLATAFVTMARLERRAALQRTYAAKAFLLARSGIEDALARLGTGMDPEAAGNRYGGEDWNADGWLNGPEVAAEAFRKGALDTDGCPLRHALRPSFFAQGSVGQPAFVDVDGRDRGYSGKLEGDQALKSNTYSLRVLPEGGIYINGVANAALGRILVTLCSEMDAAAAPAGDGLPVGALDGALLVGSRPAAGWQSLEHLCATLGWPASKAEALRPYLAFRAWVDKKVVSSNLVLDGFGVPLLDGKTPLSWAEIKAGASDDGLAFAGGRLFNARTGSYAPDFVRDGQGRIVGRSPVNLNWAKDKPVVLKALLKGLKGLALDETGTAEPVGTLRRVEFSDAEADAVASAIQTHSGFPTWASDFPGWDRTARFDSWEEFDRFVDLRVPTFAGQDREKRDLLKANFNPNSDLNKFNPNRTMFRAVDKGDVYAGSTEFCFSGPAWTLACAGRVCDSRGRLLAARSFAASARMEMLRLTAQSEFVAGDGGLGKLDEAGDETAFRNPGAAGFLSANSAGAEGNFLRTFGSKLGLTGQHAFGVAVQSYPEPQFGMGSPPPAVYDGSLQLATVETAPSDLYGRAGAMTFLASWDSGLNAVGGTVYKELQGLPPCALVAPPSTSLLGQSAGSTLMNTLYPDGVHSERNREPAYLATQNMNGFQGCFSFWIKSNFDAARRNPDRRWMRLNLTRIPPLWNANVDASTQLFYICAGSWVDAEARMICFLEKGTGADTGREFGQRRPVGNPLPPPHRWHLVTHQWDLNATVLAEFQSLVVNAQDPASNDLFYGVGSPSGTVQAITGQSSSDSESPEPNCFCLGSVGEEGNLEPYKLGPQLERCAESTYDEVAFYNLGTSAQNAFELAKQRYPAGRYYKEDDGSWTSARLDLPPGATIQRLDWTLRNPVFDPLDPADPARVFHGTGAATASGKTADVLFELLDAAGSLLCTEALPGRTSALPLPDGRLRLRATLRPRLDDNAAPFDKLNAPLLESPVLDDLTVTYTRPGGPRLLAWEARDD